MLLRSVPKPEVCTAIGLLGVCVAISLEAQQPPRTVVDLQPLRGTSSAHVRSKAGKNGVASLVNLNPGINTWFILSVLWQDESQALDFHLENLRPSDHKLTLDDNFPSGVVIVEGKNRYNCELFGGTVFTTAGGAKKPQAVFQQLCEGRLYRRNPAKGNRSTLESATEFVRDQLPGGEKLIAAVHNLLGDSHREIGEVHDQNGDKGSSAHPAAPLPARIDPKFADSVITSTNIGIEFMPGNTPRNGLTPGAWYPAVDNPGVYAGMIQPNFLDAQILQSDRNIVNTLDGKEANSLAYFVAFDLDRFDVGFELGTDHPRVGWPTHMPEAMRDASLPGPDGIGNILPLLATGMVNPEDSRRTVATFTGGYKRAHGAFKYGDFSRKNHATPYGFLEYGVIASTLYPGLSTFYILDDGTIGLKTWTAADNKLLPRLRHARQNGVPLIDFDESTQTSSPPGRLVGKWGPGNWGGNEDAKLRTIRAGAAIQKRNGKRFLIYAVFSDSTPSSMTRVFQAYGVEYAMLLDMNALEHTYMALYRKSASGLQIDHLLKGMSALERSDNGRVVPRFIGYADNRDFFYVMKKERAETKK